MGVINKFFGRFKINQDPLVTTQVTAVIQSNSGSLALVPQGVGAIVASIPDGTATGGNARGDYAVDLQMLRSNANEVAASQNSFIGGGWNNKITGGSYGAIVSGRGNTLNANSWYTFIGGGFSNSVTGDYSVVSGGQSNTASTNTHATVVGGLSNTSSGQFSISGGRSSNASGSDSIALGRSNTSSAIATVAIGQNCSSSANNAITIGLYASATYANSSAIGNEVYAEAIQSMALGYRSNSRLYAQQALASGNFVSVGDAQQSLLTVRNSSTLTTGATLVLSLDGTGATNLIIPVGTNRAWNIQINTIAIVTAITGTATGVSVGDTYSEVKNLLFKKIANVSSIVGTVDTTAVKSDTSMSACAMTITAGASQEMALTFTAPTFTGGGSVTCRVVSKVMLVEVAY
jgi:hypothetical protein